MTMTNAERQTRYRTNTRVRQENYTARLNTELLFGAKTALKRLSLHHGKSQREMLEQLILQAEQSLRQSLNEEEDDRYLDLSMQALRSNKKK
ncbi:hypothetical protein RHD99_08425 [Buttiauxella selenatireducens]|uniref:Uncharacterized protein n=1 Tax=Buttiauxella selenatireducens TaxID=3073902 RepID=A0ABY9SEL6_9ENTR|nr:hypothetical protein [Buttiauxella sp. R73]WMY75947.1 hypothetical protein RHD99_08425 [Buttiauxella sp. R73]